ncbi:two-component sensor histidine kinase [Bombiscardovia apis]|uniref:histidine kinase n=1 Tax=Bombiscardovia apis TaxID=2932182 RepID=A0ABM8BDE0_9BIFI|nr:HAMP domain-containing sensor histidine kinase [Bombiscardovia apis]BDR54919.1 two-component sensor histidine kinase [Bombiscardovia apis]
MSSPQGQPAAALSSDSGQQSQQPAQGSNPFMYQGAQVAQRQRLGVFDTIPLTTKLISCMLVLLIIGTLGISLAIRQMAGTYLQQKTDTQLIRQAKLGIRNATLLSQEDLNQRGLGPTDYFLQVRDSKMRIISQNLTPATVNGVLSVPSLPANGQNADIELGVPFTTSSQVSMPKSSKADRDTQSRAQAPWRVVAMQWSMTSSDGQSSTSGVLFMGLSLSDQMDTIHALTQYCWVVGILIVLLGAVIAALLIQSTLAPLKRIEKTAAKIAAGDLSRRIPTAPVNTEVGSLAASLNLMLSRIERSFHEQEETTRKMKQFVSDASHELRTPLAAIHGYAELYRMQRSYPGALERADESIAHIESSSARMTDLVEDLLSLARLDEGRGINTTLDVDVTTLVNDAVDDLHALDPERAIKRALLSLPVAKKGQELSSSFTFEDASWPLIEMVADPTRLRQVVTNIVGNIHRYTPADTPVQIGLGVVQAPFDPNRLAAMPSTRASLDTFIREAQTKAVPVKKRVGEPGEAPQDFVVMQFVDHGPGAQPEALQRLFERFYTADPSRAREKGGTGLGLAIVQSIVKAHHGLICASETEGNGLTFTVVIPQGHPNQPSAQTGNE